MTKSVYLVAGACGAIGRNVIEYLIKFDLATEIIALDKQRPELSWLTGNHKKAFENEIVKYKQINLANTANVEKIITEYTNIDYVINSAGESRYGMFPDVYEESILSIGIILGKAFAQYKNLKKFIQISNSEIYEPSKEKKTESSRSSPWTLSAKASAKLDIELSKITSLKYCIVRPAISYGIGDKLRITPRIIITGVYKILNKKMKLLWTDKLLMNTVHLRDISKACVFLCEKGVVGEIYNLCDKSNSTQGSITKSICEIFDVEYEFLGSIESNLAKLHMKTVVSDLNEKHMQPWFEVCQKQNIETTPLSPFLDREILENDSLCIDGSKIEALSFTYDYPILTSELIKEVIDDFILYNLFPKIN